MGERRHDREIPHPRVPGVRDAENEVPP
jgi:hypothetical protein